MRLKEDTTNWNASNVIRKLKQPPETVKHHSKKDTKRWCRGKVGVEHIISTKEVAIFPWVPHLKFKLTACETCRKQFYARQDKDTDRVQPSD